MSPDYQIIIKDGSGTVIGELKDWSQVTYSKVLNDFGKCTFTVPVTASNLSTFIGLRRFTTHVYRNNTRVWAGEQALFQGPLRTNSENNITLVSYDWFEQLYGRLITKVYDQIDAGAIFWDMINTSQNETDGDMGFTEGDIEATQPRDRNFSDDIIGEECKRLTNIINGIDFEITDDKVVNVFAQRGLDKTNQIVFEYGVNMQEITKLLYDFSIVSNQAIVRGEGMGTQQQRVVRTDTTSRGIYGLRQRLITESNVSETTTLEEKGDAINLKYRQASIQLEFKQENNSSPEFGSIGLGDVVKARVDHGIHNINNNFRVYGWEVNFNSAGKEDVQYFMAL